MPQPRRPALPLLAAVVVGALAIVGVRAATGGSGDGPGASAAPLSGAPGAPLSGASATPRPGCTTVTVVASSEKAALMAELAGQFNATEPAVDGTCVGVRVVAKASGDAEQALARGWDEGLDGPRPDVWSPAASTWTGLLRQDLSSRDQPDLLPPTSPSVVTTPLVLAVPQPMAQALGWPAKPVGWADLARLEADPAGWAALGHPEWGRFTLGKTNPKISTSGLAATVGAFIAATGRSSDLTAKDLADPAVRGLVAGVESGVVHYGDTTLTFLSNLQRADDEGRALSYVSAVAVEEKSVLDYDAGNPSGDPATLGRHRPPAVPLVAVYPSEGTLVSDSPYAVLTAPWVDPVRARAAGDFLDFLHAPAAQARFDRAGFRGPDGAAGPTVSGSPLVTAAEPRVVLAAPAPAVLAGVRSSWDELRKRARVLLVLDVSGSMDTDVPGAGATRLELAKRAAATSLAQFADTDEVGLWVFTTDLGGKQKVYAELVPVAPLGPQRAQVDAALSGLTALNGTPLYAVTRKAVQAVRASYDPTKINAVVLLTDGRNEYPPDTDLDGLVRTLREQATEDGVRVFSIAFAEAADLQALQRISEASRAAAYDATRPEKIDSIFSSVVSNF